MKKEEILEKTKKSKTYVGEMEKQKMNKGNWIALIVAGFLAVAFMIFEGLQGHHSAIFAIGAICYSWACVFYSCQYFMAKRPWPVLFGVVLEGLAAIAMIVLYIVFSV